jgi:Ca2+:H+ antiporter
VSIATTTLFLVFGNRWLADLSDPVWFAFLLGWLFTAILVSAFAVVRHAEGLAVRLGEPFGTLVLTLSMSRMEMMMIAAVMYTGQGGSSLARDTMLAIVMIVLNGLVGTSLLFGGLRYHEQTYNLYGANAFLAVILPLSVLGLVLPRFTVSSPGPTLSPLQSLFLIFMSVALYGVFLAIQTMRHRDYFVSPSPARLAQRPGIRETVSAPPRADPRARQAHPKRGCRSQSAPRSVWPGQRLGRHTPAAGGHDSPPTEPQACHACPHLGDPS